MRLDAADLTWSPRLIDLINTPEASAPQAAMLEGAIEALVSR